MSDQSCNGKASNEEPLEDTNRGQLCPRAPKIPDDLRAFYSKHDIEVDRLFVDGRKGGDETEEINSPFSSRFIRLNPRFDKDETLSLLKVRNNTR
jgi:hypothetical protein